MVLSINLLTFSKNESLLIEDQIGRLIYLSIFNLLFIEQLFIKILQFMLKKNLIEKQLSTKGRIFASLCKYWLEIFLIEKFKESFIHH